MAEWSDRVNRLLASLDPADREAAIAGFAGNPSTAEAWYDAAKAAGATNQAERFSPNQGQGADSDIYSQRDWSGSRNAAEFDRQYQRLIGMGVPANEARRIVSIALGGMEHDWSKGLSQDLSVINADWQQEASRVGHGSGLDHWVNMFLEGNKQYDPTCPPDAPYKSLHGGTGCVEKPWDYAHDSPGAASMGGGMGGAGGVGGVGGGRGQGGPTGSPNNLTSPLVDMLRNQGGIMSGYDPTRGDENPGVRGGVVGGGGIWWAPTQQKPQTGGVDALPMAPPAALGGRATVDPRYGGIMGGQNPLEPVKTGIRTGPTPWGGNTGGIMGGQDPLTAAMAPIQGQRPYSGVSLGGAINPMFPQRRQVGGLAGALMPFQRAAQRRAGSWF